MRIKQLTYPEKERNRATILNARNIDLFRSRFLSGRIANHHTLEDGSVEHHAQDTVSPHDHTSRLLALLRFPDVNFERANSTLLPFLVGEVEELRLAGEVCRLFLLSGLDYKVEDS